jgi:hypothetical protein
MLKFYFLLIAFFALNSLTVQSQTNLIKGGNMETDDEQFWSVSYLESDPTSETSFEFGYTGEAPETGQGGSLHMTVTNAASGGSHLMFYQTVNLIGGKEYKFDLAAKALQPMMNSWFEVYLGTTEPVEGEDYGTGQLALGGFKSSNWTPECDDLFNGTLQEIGCLEGSQGSFIVEGEGEQSFFIGFKVGIWDYDTTIEFVVDNVSLVEVDETSSVNAININNSIKVFPNPAKSTIALQTEIAFDAVRIMNISGQELIHSNSGIQNIDISNLQSGIFIVELMKNGKAVAKSQFIKN